MNALIRHCLTIFFFIAPQILYASSLNHYEIISGVYQNKISKKEARKEYKKLRKESYLLRFLNCPIELIEKQYNGLESVKAGLLYLEAFVLNNYESAMRFQDIEQDCQTELSYYKSRSRSNVIKSRAISEDEIAQWLLSSQTMQSQESSALIHFISSMLNQDTLCYSNRTALDLAYGIGGSIGNTSVECFTPFGRHFILSGPTIGFGLGAMNALSLPNTSLLPSAPNWSLKLYEQRYQNHILHETHLSVPFAFLGGANVDIKSNKSTPMIYKHELKPLIGSGIMLEHTHNFLRQRNRRPIYFALSKVLNLEALCARFYE
jgi:hypothetical protein